MKPLSIVLLVAEAAAASALAAAATAVAIRLGQGPWIIHPALALVFLVVAGILVWLGLQVRRFRAHKPTWIDAVAALRIAMFARSECSGRYSQQRNYGRDVSRFLTRWEAQASVYAAICGLICALGACAWGIAGIIVERWCVIDPKDDAKEGEQRAHGAKGTLGASSRVGAGSGKSQGAI